MLWCAYRREYFRMSTAGIICCDVPIAVNILGCPLRAYAVMCLSPWIFYGVHSGYMLGCAYRREYFRVSTVGICWGVLIAVNILGCPQWVYAGVCLSPWIF